MSSEAGYYFQTDSSLASSALKSKKSTNTLGNPIKLSSKILAAALDPKTGKIWLALAVGELRSVVLETGEISRPLKPDGRSAPLTSLAISDTHIFAGSWDKNIYAFALSGTEQPRTLTGHTDFVKRLLAIPSSNLLVSASADASIIIWDTSAATQLVKLAAHTRGVQALALGPGNWTVVSGDSTGELRAWSIPSADPPSAAEIALPLQPIPEVLEPLRIHETSIFDLFAVDEEMWTASADKTAKSLNPWRGVADTTLEHPDFVKCVVATAGLVATGCRDANVRVWSTAGELKYTLKGHFDEITGLLVSEKSLLSVSIDGTVRKWGLSDLEELAKSGDELERKGWVEEKPKSKAVELTEEEERELAELMDDD